MTQPPGTQPPPQSKKKIFAGLGIGALVAIIVVVVILGSIGGTIIYQAAQRPNIQATSIDTPQGTANSQTSYPVDGRVANSGSFDYTTTQAGTYTLVFDNSFSTFSSKSISTTYTVAGSSNAKSFVVQAGVSETLSFILTAGQRLSGTFTIVGGSGNDIDFYIKAQTCNQTVQFSFTLVNSGNANGYADVSYTVDGTSYWNNHYFVAQGQQLPESGSIVLGDCSSHYYNIVVSQTQKA